MVMGLVLRLSLTNHSDSESFLWHRHHSAKMDASEKDSGRGSDMCYLLLTFPKGQKVGSGLLVFMFLPGSPVVKQFIHVVTRVPSQDGLLQSVWFP